MRPIILFLSLSVFSCNYLIKPKSKIVDKNFAAAIRRQCPLCIDKDNYLTKHADTLTALNVTTSHISSLEGFRFDNLIEFDCSYNEITTLPENLPTGLEILYCNSNKIGSFPDIKMYKLKLFACSYNPIKHLPLGFLPDCLDNLQCIGNELVSLPEKLPAALTYLNCFDNQITALPENLPTNLTHLDCGYNQITALPKVLPNTLQELRFEHNLLTQFPDNLPPTILDVVAHNNPFDTVSNLD